MESVKYTTQKSRPNLFREVSGGLKTPITLLLALFTSIATFGQKVDLVNAPINPIALEYKKEHFNLKGDVYGYGYRVFSKDGMLIYEYGMRRGLHYLYKNGFPYADTEGRLYEFNSQGYLSKKTYASLGLQTQTYTYNAKGLLTKEANTKGYSATYEYDDKGRLIKSNVGGNIREFSYQKNGEQLIVTIKDLSKSPAKIVKHIYKNGTKIGENDNLYNLKYDKLGNLSGNDNAIYYSDIENRNNEISVVYTKRTYSIDPLSDCEFYINGQKADFLYKQIESLQSKDIFIYNPFTEKYYIITNAINDAKSGQKQMFSKVFINSPYYLLNRKGSSLSLGYKGAVLANTVNGMRDGALKVYNDPVYLVYDKILNQTFYGDLDNANSTGYYPLQQISPNDNVVYLKAGENQYTIVIEGKVDAIENPTHKLISSNNGGSVITDDKNNPLYYLPGTASATINKLYAGRKYNPATDKIQSANNTTSTKTTSTTAGTNTSEQTTETRYYNGRYDYDNGLSSKEVVLHKINSYIDIKNKAGATFLKLEEKQDFLSGTWTIKSSQGNTVIALDYLIGDKSLTVKLKYLMVGSQVISKNHPKGEIRNLHNVAIENFILDLFKYLEIKDNTSPKQTTTTTAGTNTFKQPSTTADSNTAVKDYSKDKITASYNENESLYARKIDNATVYFYQNNKRINQPLHYAIIEDGNNLRLFTTYTKDYYSAYALNDMLPEKLYPLTHRNGVFYLYINQSNGNFSFNYQGKALSSAQYELYKSKGDYTVVKVKSDNTIYLFKSDLTKAAISNSQSKGVLVHFADKSSIFVESGKPTEPTKWKIEKENDKYYLFNSSGSIKYSLSDYEKSINWGIYTIH